MYQIRQRLNSASGPRAPVRRLPGGGGVARALLLLGALWLLAACAPRPPPAPGPKGITPPPVSYKDRAGQMLDVTRPCLTVGRARHLERTLFAANQRSDRRRWLLAINGALHRLDADCRDTDWLVLIATVIQTESGVRVDPPLANRDLEALFDRRIDRLSEENALARGVMSVSDFDEAMREKLRSDTYRGHIRTEGDLARYMESDLRPWVREQMFDRYLVPEAVARQIELYWLPDPVTTIGPMQVNVAKAYRNAVDRGEAIASPAAMRDRLLDPDTALERGVLEGTALLWQSYRYYRQHLPGPEAAYYAAVDYNAGEFSSRNAAFQQMVSALTGEPLDLDGDLLIYGEDGPRVISSATERAVRQALPELTRERIRQDLLLEKTARFEKTAVENLVCRHYSARSGSDCPVARIPAGATNEQAELKLGRTYSPANYARAVQRRFRQNRNRYLAGAG